MAMLPFAFSIHNFISSVGADAGFAAIIGLAVLILLYFAHARETANLREEAALLTQRLQHAEAVVVQLSRGQPAAAAAASPAARAPAQLARFAPAGLAAPALAAATRVVPLVEPSVDSEEVEVAPEPVAAPVAAMAMAGVAAPASSSPAQAAPPAPPPASQLPGPAQPQPSAPAQPAEPPGSAVPTSGPPPDEDALADAAASPAIPAPATDAGGNGAGYQPVPPPAGAAEPAWSGQISASRATPSAGRQLPPLGQLPPVEPRKRGPSRLGRGVTVALAALAAVAVAVVVFALTSVGSSKQTPTASTNAPSSAHASTSAAFKPSSVTVAVLNGTSTNQLAHRIGRKLAAVGYKEGTLATAANQTETTTVVAYVHGTSARTRAANRTAALHVARALGLRRSAVHPVDQSTLQVACPASTPCTADVVVTVGADLANQ